LRFAAKSLHSALPVWTISRIKALRYALYFSPPKDDPLTGAASLWLGRNAFTGETYPAPEYERLGAAEQFELTADPRRYGFHATLKAPFRLAPELGVGDLDAAVAAAARCARFELRLQVAALGGFLALVPEEAPAALAALEEALVTRLDAFRAPTDPAEAARRRMAGLDAVEEDNLSRWGYPYVLRRFRFHMTLTGSLPAAVRGEVRAALEAALAGVLADPVPVAEVCRFAEGADGAFRLVRRFPLAA